MNKKRIAGLALAAALIVAFMLVPGNEALSSTGWRTIGVLLAFLVMLITEALPVVVTSLIFCGLLPLLGVVPGLGDALQGYASPVVFFTLASFGIAAALTNIPVSKRVLRTLLRKFGYNIQTVLLAMMITCALLSSFVSNVPTCAIFMAIALDFLKLYKNEADRKRSGRMFMIAIPVASMIGGIITPAGSSINLLALDLLEQHTGLTVSFVQWMAAGIPLAVILIPLAWFLCVKIYKPVQVTREEVNQFIESMNIPQRMGEKEKKVIAIVCAMLALWVASSWVPQINVMIVAVLGCCVFFLPGVNVLEVKTFLRDNSWDAFFLVGTVLSISGAMLTNGVSDLIAQSIPALSLSMPLIIAFSAVLIFAALVIIPVATSLIPVLAPALIAVAVGAGTSPALVMLTAAICAGNCYLLPLDTVTLITYSKGYYSMTDMPRCTIFLQIAVVILAALWLPLVGRLVGLI